MFAEFLPIPKSSKPFTPHSRKALESLSIGLMGISPSEYLPRLVHLWFSDSSHSLRIAGFTASGQDQPILISLEQGQETLAVAAVPPLEFHALVPKLRPFPEEVHDYADQEGYYVDPSWFEARNKRLKIAFREKIDHYEACPSAISELIAAYVLSSCGEVLIRSTLIPDYKYLPIDVYHLDLNFYGRASEFKRGKATNVDARGWREIIVVNELKLRQFLSAGPKKPRGKSLKQ